MSADTDPTQRKQSAQRSVRFFALCSGLLIALIVIFAFAMRLEIFSAGPHVVFAMVLGVFFTIALGVGLMALAFHSDHSGIDDQN